MNDYVRENLSYVALFFKMRSKKKEIRPERISYGKEKEQYFLCYEPKRKKSNTVIFWVHGGGWNSGSPSSFDHVGQRVASEGYVMISAGYRLSPKNKYPSQIKDVCDCFNASVSYLNERNIDTSCIIVAGPSAGAHLASILCYSSSVQKEYGVDISDIKGFVGFGGPYSFRDDQTKTITYLEKLLFEKGYDKHNAEPVSIMSKNHIPMLLIQSRHDGLIEYACAEDFAKRAKQVGNGCELYGVTDRKNTHSWYCVGSFLETRNENDTQDKFFTWIEGINSENRIDI